MRQKSFFAIQSLALCLFAILAMGVDSCSEPQEYCKHYSAKQDQAECTSFCADNREMKAATESDALVRACQLGQLGRISAAKHAGVSDVLLGCDRQFSTRSDLVAACRAGVTAEELRISRSHAGHGTSNDRETGNGH